MSQSNGRRGVTTLSQALKQRYGKSNIRKVLRMADEMADEAQKVLRFLPSWAGLAWIIDPYYNNHWRTAKESMGEVWGARAEMLWRALKIASMKRRG